MSKEMTAEEYSESEMFLKSIFPNTIAMTPSDLATYKKLVSKEAVKEFAEELIAELKEFEFLIANNPVPEIKFLARKKGVEI